MRDLDLFEYQRKGNDYVITEVADEEGWREVRDTLIASVGMNTMPVIRVIDGDSGGKRTLVLEHVHDGRDLHPEYAERTLAFVYQLWQREVRSRRSSAASAVARPQRPRLHGQGALSASAHRDISRPDGGQRATRLALPRSSDRMPPPGASETGRIRSAAMVNGSSINRG